MASSIPEVWTVSGIALLPGGGAFSQGKIKAFDLTSGTFQLGESGFGYDGTFMVVYSRSTFQHCDPTKTHPRLQVCIYDYQDTLLWESEIIEHPSANQVLDANLKDTEPMDDTWVVQGFVRYVDNVAMTLGSVYAYDNSNYLGHCELNSSGFYNISYSKASFQHGNPSRLSPNLVIKLNNSSGFEIAVREEPNPSSFQTIDFSLSLSSPVTGGENSVSGHLVNRKNLPLEGYDIEAFAANFTETSGFKDISLGVAKTNEKGEYVISYDRTLLAEMSNVALYAEMRYGELQADDKEESKVITSPLAYNASEHQIFNFVLDHESDISVNEFDEIDEKLEKYLQKLTESSELDPESSEPEKDNLIAFVSNQTRLQLTANAESKDLRSVECYFRAHLFAYELQGRFAVAQNNQTELYNEGKYDALEYVHFFYALLRAEAISKSDELLKRQPEELLVILLGSVSEQIISMDSDVRGFIDLWNEMFGTLSGDAPSLNDWGILHILLLALKGSLKAAEDNETKKLITQLLGKFYDSGADLRAFLDSIRTQDSIKFLAKEEWEKLFEVQFDEQPEIQWEELWKNHWYEQCSKIEFLLDLGDFSENYRDAIQASFMYATSAENDKNITSLNGMLLLKEDDWKTIVSDTALLYFVRTTEEEKLPEGLDKEALLSELDDTTLPSGINKGSLLLPPDFTGANGEEQQAIYTRKLYKGLLAWFPQAELAANLPAADDAAEWQAVKTFLSDKALPAYHLDSSNLGVYLKDHEKLLIEKNYLKDKESAVEYGETEILTEGAQDKLRWIQRLFRLTEHLPSISYMISQDLKSAYEVASMTEGKFLSLHSVGLGGMNKARQIHRLAVNYTMSASFRISQYHSSLSMQGDSALAISRGATSDGASSTDVGNTNIAPPRVSQNIIANWKNLFGTINRNAAIKGQSVLSPSAYLVDLLEFLKDGDGYDLLTERRPDFLNLDLTLENAQVALPMIDLAIELLETLAAEKSLGCMNFQTTGNSEDLRAQPEHADEIPEAAEKLISSVYPFALPTNFSRKEARLILDKLGLSFRDLALAFPEDCSYRRRHFITDEIEDRLLQPVSIPNGFDVWKLWGFEKETGNYIYRPDKATYEENKKWFELLSMVSVFLDRSGLSFSELEEVLLLPLFKDKVSIKSISSEAAQLGDVNGYELFDTNEENETFVSEDFARNMSRFVRLYRLLGWSFEDIDAAWDMDLDSMDMVQDLSKSLKVAVRDVIFWSREMTDSMFARVFKPLTGDEEILGLYESYETRTFKVKVEESTDENGELKEEEYKFKTVNIDLFCGWLCGRLGLSQGDLDLLLNVVGISPDNKDNIELEDDSRLHVEHIYRLSSFAKALKLSIGDFIKLGDWLGLETLSLYDCVRFHAQVQELQTNPLSYANLKQLAFAPDTVLWEKGRTFISQLAGALDLLREQYTVPEFENLDIQTPGEDAEIEDLEKTVTACLTILGVAVADEITLLQSTEEDSEVLPTEAREKLTDWLKSLVEQKVIIATEEKISELLAEETVEGRLRNLYSKLSFSIGEQLRLALEAEILSNLMSHFSITMEVAESLLKNTALLRSVNCDKACALTDWLALVSAEDENSLCAYVRLSKAVLVVSALKLRTKEQLKVSIPCIVAKVLNKLPVKEEAPAIDEDEISIQGNELPVEVDEKTFISWKNLLPLLQVLKVLKELNFQTEGYESLTNRTLLMEKLNLKESDLNALLKESRLIKACKDTKDSDLSINSDPAKWQRFSALLALQRKSYSMPGVLKSLLSTIGITIDGGEDFPYKATKEDVENYIKTVAALRMGVMGSLSLAGWREFIQPINDGLRMSKRDALAAYICWKSQQSSDYFPQAFFDTNDLYAYYLTDVGMEPDMSSARILQALNSIQQFVQRSLLGLEGRFTLTEEQKSYWEWMKNYRVWEAARKVFLYAENWIEPELRDDKTPFFKELENKLMEVSGNPDFMEDALTEYLSKMRDVGGLQIIGACKEDGSDSVLYVLHVVGRTRGEPGVLYHRRYLAKALYSGEWTPWEKIDAEIQTSSVSMSIMNGNLYLFWPEIQHKEEEAEPAEGDVSVGEEKSKSILELRLNWCYFNGKKWSGKKTTKSVLSHVIYDGFGHKLGEGESYEDWYNFRTINNSSDFIQIKVYRTWYDYDILEPQIQRIKATTNNTFVEKKLHFYKPTEYQMIEAFGEFQIWKDGLDKSTYYGNTWSRDNNANYTNFYPPANASIVHNLWMDDGTPETYAQIDLPTSPEEVRDREPQPPKLKRGANSLAVYIQEWQAWHTLYRNWRKALAVATATANLPEIVTLKARQSSVKPDPAEYGKLVYPKKNIILNNIDGPYSLYPVNFSFYTGEKLPFFFMGEDKTYLVEEVARANGTSASTNGSTSYRFNLLTHPLIEEFYKRYISGGREWLFNRETEALPMAEGYYRSYSYYNYYFSVFLGYHIAGDWEAWDLSQSLFDYRYRPVANAVTRPLPSPVTDFSWGSANGIYNWELFFHVPMRIAGKLTQEQRYEEAMDWLHMVFDPRMDLTVYERTKRWAQSLPKGSRFWRFLPFFANKDADATILETLGMPSERNKTPDNDALDALMDKWKNDPFNPHLIARTRTAAYQKHVVMKYLDNLIAWADQLFSTDTMESINEAIQLYILAAEILGPKGAETSGVIPEKVLNVKGLIKSKQEVLGNVMMLIEDDLVRPNNREKTLPQQKLSAEAGQLVNLSGNMFYFGVPRNDKLLAYWDTVADRLYKIHNSLNIEGVKRVLALYAPPIDPAMLVRARAMGLDISSVLSSLNAPLPLYRFQIMLQKAIEVVRDVQSLGGTLLSVLEKKDGEALSLMRVEHEREMLTLNKTIRQLQIDEANNHLESLQKTRESVDVRYNFYKDIEKYSAKENESISKTKDADGLQEEAGYTKLAASVMAALPNFSIGGVINVFGGPQLGATEGGLNASAAVSCVADNLQIQSQIKRSEASMAQTMGGYERRWSDWKLQEKLAKIELENLDKQILSAEIRIYVAEKELLNLERQIEQSDEIYDFMTNRFTGQELYNWMATELGRLYNDTFKQALSVAQRAERCYQFELGEESGSTSFIQTTYWDGLRQGLLAGDRLLADLRRMDLSFIDKNKRELEITRPVSLAQLNPAALRKLQEDGICTFEVPEALFDMDFPGQYFRRIKSVRLEIPCNADPSSSISAKLSLLSNKLRTKDIVGDDYSSSQNYSYNRVGIQSIATSQAQNDGGLFELNFRDERYLPFEGAGAISQWRLELPENFRQFDYSTISNVMLYISYTARDSGGTLKVKAIENIADMWNAYKTLSGNAGLVKEICLSSHDYGALQKLRAGQSVDLQFSEKDFPMFTEDSIKTVQSVRLLAKARSEEPEGFYLNIQLGESDSDKKSFSPIQDKPNKWVEIWNSKEITEININDKWSLNTSGNYEESLNNIGDIMIEYTYHLGDN